MSTQLPNDETTASMTLTVRLPAKVKGQLGRLAHATARTKSYLAGEAIANYVARELEIIAGIKQGINDVKMGRLVTHKQAMKELDAAIAKAARAPKK